jgi:hypothetical protein
MVGTRSATKNKNRSVVFWVVVSVAALLLFVFLWLAIRALIARDALLGAVPVAQSISETVLEGDGNSLSRDIDDLQSRTGTAESLTSDPIWHAAEFVPFVGANFTAFREASSMINDVAQNAIPPLERLSKQFDLEALSPIDGRFDLETFENASPMLREASTALDAATEKAQAIDTVNTVSQIGVAVDQVVSLVSRAQEVVNGLDTAAALIPAMLGADAPRDYLLVALNNSELRASGGIVGAMTVVHADNGSISLGTQSAAFSEFPEPGLPLTDSEVTLYSEVFGTYIQNVTSTPDFARSGELAQALWEKQTGLRVDGVISIDPVALGYILNATGPIDAGSGVTLNSGNATDVLLSGVYQMFDTTRAQDAFFAGVTSKIFTAVTSGAASSSELITAIGRASDENRVHVWSDTPSENELMRGFPIASSLPEVSEDVSGIGVYFNDATGGKMDYYLSSAIQVAAAVCRNDARPNFQVRVKLESRAPLDSASSLPPYVTAGENFGVEPGDISTSIFVYAPEGSVPYSVSIDGQQFAFVAAEESGHSVAGVTVNLDPGQQSEVSFDFVGAVGDPTDVRLVHTPMASPVQTSVGKSLDCDDIAPAPGEIGSTQDGA